MVGTRLTILLIVQMTLTIAAFKFPGILYKHGNYKGLILKNIFNNMTETVSMFKRHV